MLTYPIDVAGLMRDLPVCPLTDELSIGAFVIFGDVELTVHSAKKLLEKMPECDYIMCPEAKAIPLAYELSRQSGIPYLVCRKKAKAYMTGVMQVNVQSITTMGVQTLIVDEAEAAAIKGKRVVCLDDVISTGESIRAVEVLAKEAGAEVVGRMAIAAEGDAAERTDIIYLCRLPLFNPDGTPKA